MEHGSRIQPYVHLRVSENGLHLGAPDQGFVLKGKVEWPYAEAISQEKEFFPLLVEQGKGELPAQLLREGEAQFAIEPQCDLAVRFGDETLTFPPGESSGGA